MSIDINKLKQTIANHQGSEPKEKITPFVSKQDEVLKEINIKFMGMLSSVNYNVLHYADKFSLPLEQALHFLKRHYTQVLAKQNDVADNKLLGSQVEAKAQQQVDALLKGYFAELKGSGYNMYSFIEKHNIKVATYKQVLDMYFYSEATAESAAAPEKQTAQQLKLAAKARASTMMEERGYNRYALQQFEKAMFDSLTSKPRCSKKPGQPSCAKCKDNGPSL